MKQLCLMIVCLIAISSVVTEKVETIMNKGPITISKTGKSSFRVNPFSLPKDADVFWQGWVKYFHYDNGTHYDHPQAFFKNNEFFAQRIPRKDLNKGDSDGTERIPSKFQHFLVLYNNSLSIYQSREKIVKTAYDTLHIDYISPIAEDKPLKGGIRDLGDFNEGKCIEIRASVPAGGFSGRFNPLKFYGRIQTWILCTDKSKDKQKLLMMLLKLKIRRQRDFGEVITNDALQARITGQMNTINSMVKSIKPRQGKKIGKPTDGYWMLLQDWTECSLKCGGGKSWQQWMCIPPKNGGKPCKGSSIKVRPCNTQKCPGVSTMLKLVNGTASEVKKPIVKVAPFSARPQRYSKCQIKDNDAFLTTWDEATKSKKKLPVRIVMNNQTFTIFGDDSYTNSIYSFKLEYSNFAMSTQFCCFSVRDSHVQHTLCGYDSYCGSRIANPWVMQWRKDFKTFQVDCKVGRQKALLSQEDEHELDQEFNGKINAAKEELIALKAQLMEKKDRKQQQSLMRGRVLSSQKQGFTLIQKELDMENMIKKEEKEREGLEIKNVLQKLQNEKKKKKCLRKSLKQRQKQNQILLEERDSQNEISEINKEVAIEVELKRNELKRQVALMRARARRKKAALEDKVNRVRAQMAKDLLQANRNGDIRNCKKGKTDLVFRTNYCNSGFRDDYIKNSDCKENATFCYMCCENEFGNNFLESRDQCYNMCDGRKYTLASKVLKKATISKEPRGGWVWIQNSIGKRK